MSDSDILESYSRLIAYRQHLPEGDVEVPYIDEYHNILTALERATSANLTNFRVQQSAIRPVKTGGNYLTGESYYSDEPYADRALVLMKVDGVLTMFKLSQSSEGTARAPIGFDTHGR